MGVRVDPAGDHVAARRIHHLHVSRDPLQVQADLPAERQRTSFVHSARGRACAVRHELGSLDDAVLAEHVGLGLVVGVHYRASLDEHGSGLHRGAGEWASQEHGYGQWAAARGNSYLLSSPCPFAASS